MKRVLDSLNEGFHRVMKERPEVVVIGQDILDPYGGAFKVTRGLSTDYPERVITSPISEAGITGVGIGLALQKFRPVVEVMFGDFTTLIVDQLINHGTKIYAMYGQRVPLPLTVRTPMGARRGYGPTHSQSLERLFMGVPGLNVVAVSPLVDPGELLTQVILSDGPSLFVENKTLYSHPLWSEESSIQGMKVTRSEDTFPSCTLSYGEEPDVTLVTYGGMTPICLKAAARLREEEELICDVVILHEISPFKVDAIGASLRKSRRMVVAEEGTYSWGWGAEVIARLSEYRFDAPPVRVAAREVPIPAARSMEDEVLPQVRDVVAAAIQTVDSDLR
ncbi:alpha-ketoacid dehydrogenase subunit beta [Halochromatium roseum]|uniref:alpha-ketoacid dehydrogenase subunit beta n=1 Tax=Halochromatium roseum TaxID=391920 RepID=UPI0019123C68|nr:transketolase C-terminal domain-containing protein [Halochromatium roseum]MBK5941185.1 hypothetical protein [Halochromatium roseum]